MEKLVIKKKNKNTDKDRYVIGFGVTNETHLKLKEMKLATGKSIPQLLREMIESVIDNVVLGVFAIATIIFLSKVLNFFINLIY